MLPKYHQCWREFVELRTNEQSVDAPHRCCQTHCQASDYQLNFFAFHFVPPSVSLFISTNTELREQKTLTLDFLEASVNKIGYYFYHLDFNYRFWSFAKSALSELDTARGLSPPVGIFTLPRSTYYAFVEFAFLCQIVLR